MDDYKYNIESLLLSYYIKYDKMDELCSQSLLFNGSTKQVNVYIDLFDMLEPLYTKDITANKRYTIVSSIINLAAHIRQYFWKRQYCATRIYLVYGEDITLNHKQFYQSFGETKYKETMDFPRKHQIVTSQLEMVKILAAYIPEVYFVRRATNFSMFVYNDLMVNDKNNTISSVIITKDKYAYQLPALFPKAKIFRPKKSKGADCSYCITGQHIFRHFFKNITAQATIERFNLMHPGLLSLMITLTGLPSYNFTTLMNASTASKFIVDAISNNRIINGYNSDIDFVYNALIGLEKYIDPTTFKYRFNAVDLVTQYRIYNSSAESRDITWLINLNDPDTVREINDKYFFDNPLDLNSL